MTRPADQTPAKPDNLFGVCHAVGEELGIDPLWLRIGLAVALLWNPVAVLAGYAAAGIAVLVIRALLPDRSGPRFEAVAEVRKEAANEAEAPVLARAA